jgi:hypothetical protein
MFRQPPEVFVAELRRLWLEAGQALRRRGQCSVRFDRFVAALCARLLPPLTGRALFEARHEALDEVEGVHDRAPFEDLTTERRQAWDRMADLLNRQEEQKPSVEPETAAESPTMRVVRPSTQGFAP